MSTFKYPHAAERRQGPAHQQKARRNRILVVEDNQLNSKLLK
jgi:two-component system cell cycle response regulator DivK